MTITSEQTQREKRPVDLINAGSLLSDEEKRVRDRVREFVDREVIPVAADYWDRAQFPFGLLAIRALPALFLVRSRIAFPVRIRTFWEPVIIAELDDTAEAWRSALNQLATQRAPAHLHPYAGLRLGQHLVAARERVEAKQVLATASEEALALGSTLLSDRIASLSQRAGFVVASPSEESPVAGLTPRELEVLQLVADGRSNGEIASALFISTKTASVHVSNILAKLGVSGRGEAAAVAHRIGLTSL